MTRRSRRCYDRRRDGGAVAGQHLDNHLEVGRFADLEVFVTIDENVRGEDVFVIQSTSYPANDNLMELLITLDALRRSSARRVTAVVPYFGYARQDRKSGPRSPISAKLVANLITTAGANRVLTMDLHAAQIQGFFDIPVDNLFAAPLFSRDIGERYRGRDLMVVSPDVGGVVRARALAARLHTDLAIIDKRRERAGVSEVMNVIGEVEGRQIVHGSGDWDDSGPTNAKKLQTILFRAGTRPSPRRSCRSPRRRSSTSSGPRGRTTRPCPRPRLPGGQVRAPAPPAGGAGGAVCAGIVLEIQAGRDVERGVDDERGRRRAESGSVCVDACRAWRADGGAGLTAGIGAVHRGLLGWEGRPRAPRGGGVGPHAGDGWVMWRRPPCGRGAELQD